MNRPFTAHGYYCLRIGSLLEQFVEQHRLGRAVSNDSGVITERDPGPRQVHLYTADRVSILNVGDILTFPDLLPGFEVAVSRLFG